MNGIYFAHKTPFVGGILYKSVRENLFAAPVWPDLYRQVDGFCHNPRFIDSVLPRRTPQTPL